MIQKSTKLSVILIALIFTPCCDLFDQNLTESEKIKIIPEKVYIDVPTAISSGELEERFKTLSGDSIYDYMRYFVHLSQYANLIVQKTYTRLLSVDNQGILEYSFTGLDGLNKNVIIQKNYVSNGDTSDFYMVIYNKSFSDSDLALKTVWNVNPFRQTIIYQPSKLNQNEMTKHPNAIARIEYQQAQGTDYDTLSSTFIYGLTDTISKIYIPDNIMISIGKKGNKIDLVGSTNNPNSYFFDPTNKEGRNWTFVARADIEKNIACAKVALPPSWLATNENIFSDYSIKRVFADEIRNNKPEFTFLTDVELFNHVGIIPEELESPIYFNSEGFISAGPNIPAGYENLVNFEYLVPYIPVMVRDSIISIQ